ncbi:glycosyltransferase [Halomicroarcula sp. F28]|uniref:glycosyltransferase n=1 Tax=Haloarcula salinisoli TaxID=2487746 RepID=UPI001C73B90D|nr:glycosyltransferase [Halomicroarcula salinisoli]MBX0285477.1 glycosyltransferase [Halomicroarcula salinisoli]
MESQASADEQNVDTWDGASDGRTLSDLDIAIAHWHVNAWGGSEYLATRLAEALSCERIYTIGEPDPDSSNPYGDVRFVDVTRKLRLAPLRRVQARVGRLFEYALWEDVDWREYGDPDVIITSGATARAVITPDDALHLNYCHSPPRWLYDLYHDRKDSVVGQLARPLIRYLRIRDATVDLRVDGYFANSPIIARRIRKYYQRDAEVLYPPVDIDEYENRDEEGFYLHLGRLDNEKGVPEVVEAFAGSDNKLVVAGGRGDVDESVMETIRGADEIDYRGFVSESEKRDLLATCRALVFNGHEEDFGIVPIEANASGKAVLTRDEGFPGLFFEDGENGLCHDGSPAGIRSAIDRFEDDGVGGDLRKGVEIFSTQAFQQQLKSSVVRRYNQFRTAGDCYQ